MEMPPVQRAACVLVVAGCTRGPDASFGEPDLDPVELAHRPSLGAEARALGDRFSREVVGPGAAPARSLAEPVLFPPRSAPVPVTLGADWSRLYPRRGDLLLDDLTSEDRELILTFRSDRPGFRGVAYGMTSGSDDLPEVGVVEGPVRFALAGSETIIAAMLWFEAVDRDGGRSKRHRIGARLYTPELYAEVGRISPGGIVIEASDVPFSTTRVEDWVLDRASTDDIAFARATWGAVVDAQPSTRTKVEALADAILDAIDARRGVPSEELSAQAPFEQYRRAARGDGLLWCDNHAKIIVRAASSFGIPARIIRLPGRTRPGTGVPVVTADGHATTEYFDAESNRWIWIDLTMQVIGARGANGVPLHVAALHRAMTDPDAGEIVLDLYDPASGTVNAVSVDPLEPGLGLQRFFNSDQQYVYEIDAGAAARASM
jgi:hypothetical protein